MANERSTAKATPRWVKVVGIVALVLVVVIVVLVATGNHGPGRHSQRDDAGRSLERR